MKITQEEVVERQTVLQIELEEDDMEAYLHRGYQRVAQKVTVPGFRKGKASRMMVERFLGRESLIQEALDFMLPDVTERAIAEQELESVGTPRVELLEMDPFTLKATVALTPEVDLGGYRELRVAQEQAEVTEEDIQKRLEEMRERAASWEPVERSVDSGDMVTIDVKGTVEGRTVLEEDGAVYVADEEGELPFPGFSKNLVGAEIGVAKEFTIPISEEYADVNLAGKKADFSVSVSEVKERKLPDLDDELAKGVGEGFETLAELRENVVQDLQDGAEAEKTAQHREATFKEFLELGTVELPPLLVEHEVEHAVARRDQMVESLNIRQDDYLRITGKTEEEVQEEMQADAVERLTRSYALRTLAEQEGLDVSTEEIDNKIQEIVASRGEEAEAPSEQDLDSEELRGSIRRTILAEKAVDRLIEIANGEAPALDGASPNEDTEEQEPDEGGDAVDDTT